MSRQQQVHRVCASHLRARADVLRNLCPVVAVQLEALQQQQRLLLRPVPRALARLIGHHTSRLISTTSMQMVCRSVTCPMLTSAEPGGTMHKLSC